MSCAILLNPPGCTKRIYSESPLLKHNLQSNFRSLVPRSGFFLHFSIQHSLFSSETNSFGEGCSDIGWKDLGIHYTKRKNINKSIQKININCSCVRGRFSSPGLFPVQLVKPGYIWNEPAAKNVRAQCDDVQRLVWFGMIFTFHQRNYLILFHAEYFQGSLLFFCLLWLLGLIGGNISFNSEFLHYETCLVKMRCSALFFWFLIQKTLLAFAMFIDTQGSLYCITCQTWFVCFPFPIVCVFLGENAPKFIFFRHKWQKLMFQTLLISQYEEINLIWQHRCRRWRIVLWLSLEVATPRRTLRCWSMFGEEQWSWWKL